MLRSGTQEQAALLPILDRMQVPHDGTLIVHSAIARLSRQGFRAEAMIETFVDYLRGGTLAMPTMTWRTVTPQQPDWDELATPSRTGVLTEVFRTRYAAARSIHPTHSVAACGTGVPHWLSQHHLEDTPVSLKSPYGLMRQDNAYVLMLGVGLETCTAIHLPEEAVAPDVYLRPLAEPYDCCDRHGVVHTVQTRRHWSLDRDFPKFGPPLERGGLMISGTIGDCPYAIVGLQPLLDLVWSTLRADRHGTLRGHPVVPVEDWKL
jgi:aminoglycoside 3-N-acetyltransferase